MGAINACYRLSQRRKRARLEDVLYPAISKSFYYSLFGEGGFQEFQCFVPSASIPSAMGELISSIRLESAVVALATMKPFRTDAAQLDFGGDGATITLDIPRHYARAKLMERMESIVAEHNGKLNVVKYSRLTARLLTALYPEADAMREALLKFDPRRRFRSALSHRLAL